MAELANQEEDLYPPIQMLMEGRGYAVIPQFELFSALTESRRKLDLLGFRRTDDDDLEAWAVEAKQGASPAHVLTALGQAIEYQLYVPRVSVAAEVPRDKFAFAESPLRQLGLGYIHATPTSATEIITPSLSPRFYQNEFNHVIRHAGLLCLLGRELWNEANRREHSSGGEKSADAQGYPLYAIHNNEPVQYMLIARGKSEKVQLEICEKVRLEIWIERKPVLSVIYPRVEAGRLAELLGKSEVTMTIFKFQRDHFGKLGPSLDERHLLPDQKAIAQELACAREWLKEDRVSPVISVAHKLWEWDAMPRFAEATKAFAKARELLEPTREYFAAIAKK